MAGLGVVASYMTCTTSLYGAASLTKRAPAALTMRPPGRVRSARQKYGWPGSGIAGPHQASSIRSSAAPSPLAGPDAVAGVLLRADRPVRADGLPLVLLAHGRVVLEAARADDHAAAGADQAGGAVPGDDHAGHGAVLDVQVGERAC